MEITRSCDSARPKRQRTGLPGQPLGIDSSKARGEVGISHSNGTEIRCRAFTATTIALHSFTRIDIAGDGANECIRRVRRLIEGDRDLSTGSAPLSDAASTYARVELTTVDGRWSGWKAEACVGDRPLPQQEKTSEGEGIAHRRRDSVQPRRGGKEDHDTPNDSAIRRGASRRANAQVICTWYLRADSLSSIRDRTDQDHPRDGPIAASLNKEHRRSMKEVVQLGDAQVQAASAPNM